MATRSRAAGKIERYNSFWCRTPIDRPLIGFSVGEWFPLQSYRAMQKLRGQPELVPDDLRPEEFLTDYEGIVASWDGVEDDMIRGRLDTDDLSLVRAFLSPEGLYLQIVVETAGEARMFGEFFRPWR